MLAVDPIAPILIRNLVVLGRAYAKAKKLKLSTVSDQCHGDGRVLDNLAKGKSGITLAKYDAMMRWFIDRWPEETEWPAVRIPTFREG